MPKLHLPESITIVHTTQSSEDKKLVTRTSEVTSSTEAILVPFSGKLKDSFSEEAVASKKTLTLFPGQTKEFTKDEAEYLVDLYPFIQVVQEEASVAPAVVDAPGLGEAAPNLVTDLELPTNFMQLKKFATAKGCDILPTDKKDDILAKLAQIQ